jgi:hypothetical protein
MKYFLDTEFLEGTQKTFLGKTVSTIDLISIGIVAEDGRKYYAISNDFNLKEAWNRYDLKHTGFGDRNNLPPVKDYWIRNNVLKNLFNNHVADYNKEINTFKEFKNLVEHFGKTNKQITEEVCDFIDARKSGNGIIMPGGTSIKQANTLNVEFYGYYADYDWVAFCWLFGKMIDLPKGFPTYCVDLKQILDEKLINCNKKVRYYDTKDRAVFGDAFGSLSYSSTLVEKEEDLSKCSLQYKIEFMKKYNSKFPKQVNEHNALADAEWTFELYKFLQTI